MEILKSTEANIPIAPSIPCNLGVLKLASVVLLVMTQAAEARDIDPRDHAISPARGIIHAPNRGERERREEAPGSDPSYRNYDGSNNNLSAIDTGAAGSELLRAAPADYADGFSTLAGPDRASPRAVSNIVFTQTDNVPNEHNASDYLWQWGQFLDHDIDLTDGTDPAELANIIVPAGDEYFDPDGDGTKTIAFNRSIYSNDDSGVRQQLNEVTAWIDASNVYGSDETRALTLRTLNGDGKLNTSDGNFLPYNTEGLPNAGGNSASLFLAGDVRANEQIGLTALHTLFMREHNRLAERIASHNPKFTGEEIYQKARQLVAAEMQIITYREYLPALLGSGVIAPYTDYAPDIDASISNSFSTAAYRYGHSALSSTLLRIDRDGNEIADGHLALRDAFFDSSRITDEGGIEPLLRGLAAQTCQKIDSNVIDDVRNFLFGQPGAGGFDLVALNIQRGRDHGLPSYNEMRASLGFERAQSFSDISSDPQIQQRLAEIYTTVEGVDLWVGGLAEDTVSASHLGPLFQEIIAEQFEALRDGDRYWHELTLDPRELDLVRRLRLADIIRLNTSIDDEIQNNVFQVTDRRRHERDREHNRERQAAPTRR